MLGQANADTGIADGRAKDRDAVFSRRDQNRILVIDRFRQFADEFPAGVLPGFQGSCKSANHGIVFGEKFFIDISVINPVDEQLPQFVIVRVGAPVIMSTTQRGIKILIKNGPRGYDHIHHVVMDHIPNHFSQTCGDQRSGKAQHDGGPLGIGQHFFKYAGTKTNIAGLNGTPAKGVHQIGNGFHPFKIHRRNARVEKVFFILLLLFIHGFADQKIFISHFFSLKFLQGS